MTPTQQSPTSAKQAAMSLAVGLRAPLLDLTAFDLAQAPRGLLDSTFLQDRRILPLAVRAGQVFIATADPADRAAIEAVRLRTGMATKLVVVEPQPLTAALAALAHHADARGAEAIVPIAVPADAPGTPLPPAVTPQSVNAPTGGLRQGPPATAADSTALRNQIDEMIAQMMGSAGAGGGDDDGPRPGPTQCHDITVYPAIGLAGGACGGYGLLLDISDPANPTRLAAVADSNFSYWHSATFNNDGTTVMFTDEWGGGGQPKCRASDPMEWGANAIFTIEDGDMVFQSYYKMPAPQTSLENCVAHNGSLIPIPGRDIMIQGWYQGGISLIDWTDPANPVEIGFHDRGPSDGTRQGSGGSWSVYWYNGVIVNSEISRGLDIFELVANESITQNEIDAANSVVLTQLNSQGQPIFEWPATFALARAYLDQLERWHGMTASQIAAARQALADAEGTMGSTRTDALRALADELRGQAAGAMDPDKAAKLVDAVQRLAAAG